MFSHGAPRDRPELIETTRAKKTAMAARALARWLEKSWSTESWCSRTPATALTRWRPVYRELEARAGLSTCFALERQSAERVEEAMRVERYASRIATTTLRLARHRRCRCRGRLAEPPGA